MHPMVFANDVTQDGATHTDNLREGTGLTRKTYRVVKGLGLRTKCYEPDLQEGEGPEDGI